MRWILATAVFAFVLAGHFYYVTRPVHTSGARGPWASYEFDAPEESRWDVYRGPCAFWLGLSYASAGAFASLCLAHVLELRRQALSASASGLALSGVIWGSICFFTGCCGSPMLPIYLGLFGSRFVNVTKPLTFGITLLSILVGYAWMLKRAPKSRSRNVHARVHEAA